MNEYSTDATKEEIELAETILGKVMNLLELTGQIEIRRRDEGTILDVQGCNNPGRLIGSDGTTLQSVQLLTTLIICRKLQRPTSILIDVNGYRNRRRMQMEELAWDAYDRVIESGESVILKPLNASDRRVIHMTLSECEEIGTRSLDEEPETGMKSIEIFPKETYEN